MTQHKSVDAGPGPDGASDLRDFGVAYFYDEADWEATYDSTDTGFIEEWIDEGFANEPYAIRTLFKGPTVFAAKVPIIDEHGDTIDNELRFYATVEAARAALALARGEQQ